MTIKESIQVLCANVMVAVDRADMGEACSKMVEDALYVALASLKAWDEVKADIDNQLYVDSLIFGELMDFKEGKISADDVIDEFNRVAKAEIMKIISEHLPEEYQHE